MIEVGTRVEILTGSHAGKHGVVASTLKPDGYLVGLDGEGGGWGFRESDLRLSDAPPDTQTERVAFRAEHPPWRDEAARLRRLIEQAIDGDMQFGSVEDMRAFLLAGLEGA